MYTTMYVCDRMYVCTVLIDGYRNWMSNRQLEKSGSELLQRRGLTIQDKSVQGGTESVE